MPLSKSYADGFSPWALFFSHSMPSVHQNKSFGKASLWQIKCVFPTLTRCFKHNSLAALLHKHAFILGCPPSKRRIQNRSALFPALPARQFGLYGFSKSEFWILFFSSLTNPKWHTKTKEKYKGLYISYHTPELPSTNKLLNFKTWSCLSIPKAVFPTFFPFHSRDGRC